MNNDNINSKKDTVKNGNNKTLMILCYAMILQLI